ncbi:MAG TPA: S8 family serine peptidase [Thermoanaerobaculia bacterium]
MIPPLRLGALLAGIFLTLSCAGSVPRPAEPPAGASQASASQQVMVTYPPAPPSIWAKNSAEIARNYGLRFVGAWTMTSLGEQCAVFEVLRGSADSVVRRLSSDPLVGLAQTIQTFETQAYNDPLAHLQYNSQTLRLDQAHRMATGKGVRVAVVDTGVDIDHPDLRGRVIVAQDFAGKGQSSFTTDVHGTAIAGVIAASANNDVGIVGVAPEAQILALKACWHLPSRRGAMCNSYTLAQAVDFAVAQGAQVLNFSLAGPKDPILGRLLGAALSRGIVVVAADGGPSLDFPATREGVIGLRGSDPLRGGLTGPDKTLSSLAAPGVDILTTAPPDSYDFFSGSSLAAAQVSGIAALLLEKNPKLTPAQVAEIIRRTAHPLAATSVSQVDACAALASAQGHGDCG